MLPIRAGMAALVIVLNACSLSHLMPPFSATRAYAGAPAPTSAEWSRLPARRAFHHRSRIVQQYDTATNQTRVSLTTHQGNYFLWIQQPRLTFFYVYDGATISHAPATVLLVFRTVNPQIPNTNRLMLTCDGVTQDLEITPTFWLEPGALTTSRHYMYEMSTGTFARLLGCNSTSVAVSDVRASFSADQLEALRDFAAGMRGP